MREGGGIKGGLVRVGGWGWARMGGAEGRWGGVGGRGRMGGLGGRRERRANASAPRPVCTGACAVSTACGSTPAAVPWLSMRWLSMRRTTMPRRWKGMFGKRE